MEASPNPFRRFWNRSSRYFTKYGEDVARYNLTLLRRSAVAFSALLAVYGPIVYFFFNNNLLTHLYLIFGVVSLAFTLFALFYGRKMPPQPSVMRVACVLFIVTPLAFTACINVLPYPDNASPFFPMVYILVSVLFLLPIWMITLTLTLSTAGYIVFILLFENPIAAVQDIFSAVTVWLLGFFFLYLVTDLRLSEGERRMELEHISTTDPLTGLSNRRWVEENLPLAYRRCQLAGLPTAAIMMDVDNFKRYNDSFGHQAGDRCLITLGQTIRDFSAELGIYSARYGGEEFIFLLPGCSSEEAMAHAEELLTRIRALDLSASCGCAAFTASLGVAAEERPDGQTSYPDLVRKADAALYQAKAWGKDRAFLYRPEMPNIGEIGEAIAFDDSTP